MSGGLNSSSEGMHGTPSKRSSLFKVRIADIDHYMAAPGPLDLAFCQFLPPKVPVAKVPVLRVFGANEAGQKCCLHIHRAYPYFYVPYEGELDETTLNTFIHTLGLSLNRATTLSYGGDPNNVRKSQYVAAIIPVKGVPFYGYHVGYANFLKIYLFNPDNETRIVDLMRGGAVMNRSFQPFEAHIPFRLQFCIDFNLYGMGWVEMESALFRNDVPHSYEGEHPKRWTIDNVVDENIWAVDKGQTKISNCEVELDTTIDQIINRDRAPERNTHHTLEECFKAPLTQAQVPSVAGLWEDDAIRRRAKGLPSQEPPKTQAREKEAMPWHNHDRALAMVAELVHEVMLQENASTPPTFESFIVKENPETRPWMTAYEAVNALCPQPVAEGGMGNADPSEVLFDEGDSSIIINEDVISQAVGASEVRTNAKQTRDGVRGMDDIEADDDDHELFGLLGDEFVGLDEDDLLNVVDQWEDLAATSDTDVASHVPGVVRPPTERPHKDYPSSVAPRSLQIPQYDGSGDHDDEDDDFVADSELPDMRKRKHQTSAEAEWRSHMRSSGSKRSKSRQPLISPSSTTSSSTRSWSQGNESNGRTRPDISSTSQHTLTSRASQPPSSTSRLGSQASVPRSLPFSSLHSRLSPARVLSSLGSTVANTPSPASHMRPLPAVEIPISASKSSAATLRQIMPRSRFLVNDEDDPIIDDDDSLENIFANDEFCAMDEPQVAGQHQAQSFEHSSRYEPQLQEKPTSHEQGSKLDFPAPASPHHQYFMSTLSEMWSSPSPSPPKLSFFNAPPRAFSPSAIQEVSSLPGPAGTAEPMLVDDQATKDLSGLDKTESQKSAPEHTASQPAESDTSSVFTSPNRSKRSRRVSWHPSPDVVYTFAAEPPQDEIQAGALLSSVVEETFIAEDSDDEGSDSRRSVNLKDIQLEDTFKASAHEQSELSSKSSRSSSSTSSRHRGSVVLAEDSFEANKSDEILLPSSLFSSSPRWSMALPTCHSYQFNIPAPTASGLLSTLDDHHLPHIVHQKPFFSNAADLPPRSKTFGGKEFRLESHDLAFTRRFVGGHNTLLSSTSDGADKTTFTTSLLPPRGTKFWEPVQPPPTYAAMTAWLASEEAEKRKKRSSVFAPSTQQQREKISQLEAPTPKNPYGYKNSPTKVAGSAAIEKDHMDLFSMEVMCHTRGELLPDPKQDMILAIFYCWQTEREEFVSNGWEPGFRIGMITHEEASFGTKMGLSGLGENSVKVTQNEREMIEEAMRLVRDLDPDILVGYEIHNASWGYLVDRYQALAGADLAKMISRIHYHTVPTLTKRALEERNSYNSKHSSGIKIIGRHMFNVWRLIRSEVALTNYGFSNVIFHVLQQRIPSYSHRTLTTWWTDGSPLHQSRVIRHYLSMVQYSLQLIEVQELVSRTSEFARVFGIDFFSVISRGSQYKVESLMVRLAKPENYIMISPSRQQVGSQRAAECLPMIMEPESAFYEDPVAVLDFQSLYPSVMIAYNYCYSTCLGKLGGGSKLGVTEYRPQPGILPLVKDHLHVAPNNVMYVNQEIRRGLLGRMLTEILETRVMVKKAMKDQPDDKSLLKLLQARQMGLKFLANVTYGYTCASFSGRMPGIEIADSIVHSARETLERAIQFVGENPKWKARVVYGDTDSMFVHLPGRTREEAFEIAYDIAETITRMNPRPVKLKFEKIYHGCFLVTKKRYVGASYEYPGQVEPIFDAKGIETIRRDGVPAVQKIMETCIKTMFRTQDLSQVKAYLLRQWSKILQGRCPVPDFMFGKEVRLGSYSDNGVPPPGAVVSARRMEVDPRAEPQHKERVPYVVVYGEPGARLTDQVVEPKELLRNPELQLNGQYYITKQIIPSLERILQLAGADVKSWFESMPKVLRAPPLTSLAGAGPTAAMRKSSKQRKMAKAIEQASAPPLEQQAEASGPSAPPAATAEPHNNNPFAAGALPSAAEPSLASGSGSSNSTGPSRPKPGDRRRRRGGKGFVTLGPRIERFYQSVNCLVCEQRITSPHRPLLLPKSRSRLSFGSGGGGNGSRGSLMPPSSSSASILASLSSILCSDCLDNEQGGRVATMLALQGRLRRNERDLRATVDVCSSCCGGGPPQGGCGVAPPFVEEGHSGLSMSSMSLSQIATTTTTGTELVACESIECPVFWRRRKEQRTRETLQTTVQRCLDKLEALDRAEQYELFLQAEQEAFNAESDLVLPEVEDEDEDGERGDFAADSDQDEHLMEALLLGGEAISKAELVGGAGSESTEDEDGDADSDTHALDW